MMRNFLQKGILRRLLSSGSKLSKVPEVEPITVENYRSVQLQRLQNMNPEQFDKNALYHLIGDFLVKPEQPDLLVTESLLNTFQSKLHEIDPKAGNESVAQIAVDFVSRVFELQGSSVITPFIMEFVWESLINNHWHEAGQSFYDVCVKHAATIESLDFSFDAAFKERLVLELFLPCRNQAMIDKIVSDSVVDEKIGITSATMTEIFQVAVEPEVEDPYPDPELFSAAAALPRFHALVALLERWQEAGIPIKGDSVSKALSSLFQKFLPSEKMLKQLEAIV